MSFRVAVVGAGRMGKLHARVLSDMPQAELVCVVDINPSVARSVARQRSCQAFTDAAEAIDKVDAAIIAVPTLLHVQAALPFVAAGKDVLIDDHAWLGDRVIVLPGVRIGRHAIIGAGAVVSKDVPDYAIAVGNPAVVKKYRKRIEDTEQNNHTG